MLKMVTPNFVRQWGFRHKPYAKKRIDYNQLFRTERRQQKGRSRTRIRLGIVTFQRWLIWHSYSYNHERLCLLRHRQTEALKDLQSHSHRIASLASQRQLKIRGLAWHIQSSAIATTLLCCWQASSSCCEPGLPTILLVIPCYRLIRIFGQFCLSQYWSCRTVVVDDQGVE